MSKQIEIKLTTTGSVRIPEHCIDWATEDDENIAIVKECKGKNSLKGLLEPDIQESEITEVKL